MNKEVDEAIAELEESIANANEHIELLKQFEQLAEKGLSETDYHTFCETDLRHSNVLGKALEKVFPFLTYEKRGCNAFGFRFREKITDCIVKIPSSSIKSVEIVFNKYYRDEETATERINERFMWEETNRKGQIDKKEAFLGTRSVFKRSRIIYPYTHPVIAFFAYLFSGAGRKRKDEISSELVELYKKKKATADKKHEMICQEKLGRDAQQLLLLYYIPIFLKWTDTVYVYEKGREGTPVETHKRNGKEQDDAY